MNRIKPHCIKGLPGLPEDILEKVGGGIMMATEKDGELHAEYPIMNAVNELKTIYATIKQTVDKSDPKTSMTSDEKRMIVNATMLTIARSFCAGLEFSAKEFGLLPLGILGIMILKAVDKHSPNFEEALESLEKSVERIKAASPEMLKAAQEMVTQLKAQEQSKVNEARKN